MRFSQGTAPPTARTVTKTAVSGGPAASSSDRALRWMGAETDSQRSSGRLGVSARAAGSGGGAGASCNSGTSGGGSTHRQGPEQWDREFAANRRCNKDTRREPGFLRRVLGSEETGVP